MLDKKNLIILSTLLFVFLLVIFNLGMFTGDAAKLLTTANARQPLTSVKVVPGVIEAGDYVNVYITPGFRCAERKVLIYEEGGSHAAASFERTQMSMFSGYRFCKPTVAKYKSRNDWQGSYYVLVKDVSSNQYIKARFFVE